MVIHDFDIISNNFQRLLGNIHKPCRQKRTEMDKKWTEKDKKWTKMDKKWNEIVKK